MNTDDLNKDSNVFMLISGNIPQQDTKITWLLYLFGTTLMFPKVGALQAGIKEPFFDSPKEHFKNHYGLSYLN